MKKEIKQPTLSAELFVIPLEKHRYLVYAPLRKAAFVCNAPVVNLIADLKEGIYNVAADPDNSTVEFLRRLEIVDAGEETPPVGDCEGTPEPTAVSLFLTTACNLRCTYCYASAGDTFRETMPLDVAKRGIDFVIRNAVKHEVGQIEINYHGGGEPTVNWRTLTGSLNYARRKAEACGLTVVASSATNGMLNDRQIDWIIANLQGLSLSFDGLPEAQDKHRVRLSGRGSSEKVIHTIRRLDEAGFNYGIRMTATADLIPSMADSVDYLFSNFSAASVQIEPAFLIGRYANKLPTETEAFLTAFRESQRRAKKYGHEITYSGARIGILTSHFCALSQDMFALLPDGAVSSCFEAFSRSNPYSHIFLYGEADGKDGYRFDMERLAFLRRQSVQHREHCSGCFAKWTCAGDCFHKAVVVSGSKEFNGTGRCHINRELTKDLILARIADAGGLCWHELPDRLREEAARQMDVNTDLNITENGNYSYQKLI
jgi:uncharacterized protein